MDIMRQVFLPPATVSPIRWGYLSCRFEYFFGQDLTKHRTKTVDRRKATFAVSRHYPLI